MTGICEGCAAEIHEADRLRAEVRALSAERDELKGMLASVVEGAPDVYIGLCRFFRIDLRPDHYFEACNLAGVEP